MLARDRISSWRDHELERHKRRKAVILVQARNGPLSAQLRRPRPAIRNGYFTSKPVKPIGF